MTHRRTHDEHVALFAAFAARIAALPPSAWSNIEARCAELSDPSFRALLARAALSAKPHQLWLPEAVRNRGRIRAIKSVSDAVQHGLAFTLHPIMSAAPAALDTVYVTARGDGPLRSRMRQQPKPGGPSIVKVRDSDS